MSSELLLANGVDPNYVDRTGKSAIVYAAAKGFAETVRLLLDAGVDVDARYGNDLTVADVGGGACQRRAGRRRRGDGDGCWSRRVRAWTARTIGAARR